MKQLTTSAVCCLLLCMILPRAYGQQIRFAKGVYHHHGKSTYYSYVVDGYTHQVSGYNPSFWPGMGLPGYMVGYNVSDPAKAQVYYNKPYFDSTQIKYKILNTTGKIIYVNKRYCVYQFMANKVNKEPVTAHQDISKEDLQNHGIQPGASFKVQYLDKAPEVAIIYWDSIAENNVINDKAPFLTRPNGTLYDFESDAIFMQPRATNQYLSANEQRQIHAVVPAFMFSIGHCYKSGLWFGGGIGGGPKLFAANFGLGYMQKINRNVYISASAFLSSQNYSVPAFSNPQFKTVADTSQFSYTNWYFNPKIDFIWRNTKNNVRGTSFVKLGIGAFISLQPNRQWVYQTGYAASNGKGGKTTDYNYVADVNNMPPLPGCMFYISLSYSFCHFRKQ